MNAEIHHKKAYYCLTKKEYDLALDILLEDFNFSDEYKHEIRNYNYYGDMLYLFIEDGVIDQGKLEYVMHIRYEVIPAQNLIKDYHNRPLTPYDFI